MTRLLNDFATKARVFDSGLEKAIASISNVVRVTYDYIAVMKLSMHAIFKRGLQVHLVTAFRIWKSVNKADDT
jgi:hypothetical protein